MDQTPLVLASHRILVAVAQVTLLVGFFQLLYSRWKSLVDDVEQLDRPLVLIAAVHQQLFFVARTLKGGARQLLIKRKRHSGGEQEHDQKREATFIGPVGALHPVSSLHPGSSLYPGSSLHPGNSSISGRVC